MNSWNSAEYCSKSYYVCEQRTWRSWYWRWQILLFGAHCKFLYVGPLPSGCSTYNLRFCETWPDHIYAVKNKLCVCVALKSLFSGRPLWYELQLKTIPTSQGCAFHSDSSFINIHWKWYLYLNFLFQRFCHYKYTYLHKPGYVYLYSVFKTFLN